MTEPPDPSPPDGPPVVDPQPIVSSEPGPVADSARPGLRTFSLEGRRAPGLYLVGWLGTILGGALLIVAALARPGGAGGLVLGVIGTLLLAIGLVAAAGAQGIDRRDRADLAYRGPSPFLVFAASVPLVVVIGLPFALVGLEPDSPIAALASVSVTCAIWLTLVAMTVVGIGALSWRDVFVGWVDTPLVRIAGDLAIGAVAAVPVLLATTILAAVLVSIMGVAPDPPIVIPPGGTGLLIGILAAAVVAPISEEIFYRGFATTAWARSFGPTGAIVRGGLFFAAVHVLTIGGSEFEPAVRAAVVGFVVRLPVAFALGWIFVRRRSLPASIGLHAAYNGIAVLITAAALG